MHAAQDNFSSLYVAQASQKIDTQYTHLFSKLQLNMIA